MFVFSDRMRQSGPGKTSSESDESTAARSLGDEVRHDRDDKVLPGLGGVVIPTLANGDLQRLPVDVVLPESVELAEAHRGEERRRAYVPVLPSETGEERADLLELEVVRDGLVHLERLDVEHRVRAEVLPRLDREVEDSPGDCT